MLTCSELDRYFDQLCDLTRQMGGVDRVREATDLLGRAADIERFLMEMRAAAVADLHYLDNIPLRHIAPQVGKSFQAISFWLRDYGPRGYLSLRRDPGSGAVEAIPFDVEGEHTLVKIGQYRRAGRLIVPAAMNIYDPDQPNGARADEDLQALWDKLANQLEDK